MFKQCCVSILFTVLFLSGCSHDASISETEKKQALEDYQACNQLADAWLAKLDSSNYLELTPLVAFDKKSAQKQIHPTIKEYQTIYGQVKKREFLGAHFWSGKKLISWVPNVTEKMLAHIQQQKSSDDFYNIAPKYFGHFFTGQMFFGYPAGRYVVLMYRSVPTNKSYAEEKIILRQPKNGNWQIHEYEIADDI